MYKKGDANTKYFHALTKQRRARNRIIGLHNASKNWVTSEEAVEEVVVTYFDDIFLTTSLPESTKVLEEVPVLITNQLNELLTGLETEEEEGFVYDASQKSRGTGWDNSVIFPAFLAYCQTRYPIFGQRILLDMKL